jgi:hypothetical protein
MAVLGGTKCQPPYCLSEEKTWSDLQVPRERRGGPVLDKERENDENGDREEIVVKHGIPIFESGDLDSLSHKQDLRVSIHLHCFSSFRSINTKKDVHRRQRQDS